MLDKLFGRKKKTEPDPDIHFGRYSDNNKPVQKVNRWTDADSLFKEKKYHESIDAFFDYITDDTEQNVVHERKGSEGRFYFYQGSKVVRGSYDNERLQAEVTLAKMPQPSVPVMRRLLEMNFNLYYSRFALQDDRLCMRFDTDIETANPSKLYYGFKELSTKADKQDDLLVQDFTILQTSDTEHITDLPVEEKEVKFRFLQQWLKETTELVAGLDADKFSGGIAYLLLALAYRIDYLLVPDGKLLNELEKIVEIYFIKDERPVPEKNRDILEALKLWQAKTREEVFPCLFKTKHTFAIVMPQNYKTVADALYNANQSAAWFRDNNYPQIALQICEYGIAYSQYSYSLPRPVTELFQLFMNVIYGNFFNALGFKKVYYNAANGQFAMEAIAEKIKSIQDNWKNKFPLLTFRVENLHYDNLLNFALSFTTELEFLNFETK